METDAKKLEEQKNVLQDHILVWILCESQIQSDQQWLTKKMVSYSIFHSWKGNICTDMTFSTPSTPWNCLSILAVVQLV